MTPEERARKIILALWMTDNPKAEVPESDIKYLAAQIKLAVDEAIKEKMISIFEGEDCCVAELERDMYQKGFRNAIEKAANILESYSHVCRCEMDMKLGGAKAIRSLTPDNEKEINK